MPVDWYHSFLVNSARIGLCTYGCRISHYIRWFVPVCIPTLGCCFITANMSLVTELESRLVLSSNVYHFWWLLYVLYIGDEWIKLTWRVKVFVQLMVLRKLQLIVFFDPRKWDVSLFTYKHVLPVWLSGANLNFTLAYILMVDVK